MVVEGNYGPWKNSSRFSGMHSHKKNNGIYNFMKVKENFEQFGLTSNR